MKRIVNEVVMPTGETVTLKAYVKAIKKAKSMPDAKFDRSIFNKKPCTGQTIHKQFVLSLLIRINSGRNYNGK